MRQNLLLLQLCGTECINALRNELHKTECKGSNDPDQTRHLLMSKMPDAGEDHRDPRGIGGID